MLCLIWKVNQQKKKKKKKKIREFLEFYFC